MTKADKRSLVTELTEGFEALAASREGQIDLKTHSMEALPAPEIAAPKAL